jgi:hypothetical protein
MSIKFSFLAFLTPKSVFSGKLVLAGPMVPLEVDIATNTQTATIGNADVDGRFDNFLLEGLDVPSEHISSANRPPIKSRMNTTF